jgi:hypothetical protein
MAAIRAITFGGTSISHHVLSMLRDARGMTGTALAYDLPHFLAVLKLPLGALSAIGGLLIIRGEFVPGFSDLDSQDQILAYAFAFGVAQQLVVGLIDRQSRTLLSSEPGKATSRSNNKRGAR